MHVFSFICGVCVVFIYSSSRVSLVPWGDGGGVRGGAVFRDCCTSWASACNVKINAIYCC